MGATGRLAGSGRATSRPPPRRYLEVGEAEALVAADRGAATEAMWAAAAEAAHLRGVLGASAPTGGGGGGPGQPWGADPRGPPLYPGLPGPAHKGFFPRD